MSRIAETFTRLQNEKRAAFMPYLVAGDPDAQTTVRLILAMEAAGASLIELGVPFSDPMADGPTNQAAAQRALAGGMTLAGVLGIVRQVREQSQIPILLMGYYNVFFSAGLERLCADAAEAGADGFIIPDLQPDDADEILQYSRPAGLDAVFLIAPTSTDARLERVAACSSGFVYAVSLTGVTGERDTLPPTLASFVERARAHIPLPIAVGFGISTPAMVQGVGALADGVIVGSAIVKRIAQAAEAGDDPVPPVEAFVRSLAEMLR